MRLYFNGCSHTFGDDLKDQNQAWPALVAEHYKCDFLNDSVSGGTNDRIMYRTIKHSDQFDKFYIAWSYTSRFTRYRADNNHDVNFNPMLVHSVYADSTEFKDYGKLHYLYWHNELYAFKLWLQNIILLQRFFESIKKPYVMVNAHNNLIDRWTVDWPLFNNSVKSLVCIDLMNDLQMHAEHTEIQNLLKQINVNHYVGWNTWWLVKLKELYPTGPTGHLLEQGHRATSEYIINHDSH